MSRRSALSTIWLVCVIAVLPGCGGGGDADENAAASSPKAEYIEEADAVCSRQTRKIERLIAPYTKGRDLSGLRPAEAKAMVRRVLGPALGYEVRSVRLLLLPPRFVDRVLVFLTVWQRTVEAAEENPVAFVHAEQPFAAGERLAREFGFKVCGSLRL